MPRLGHAYAAPVRPRPVACRGLPPLERADVGDEVGDAGRHQLGPAGLDVLAAEAEFARVRRLPPVQALRTWMQLDHKPMNYGDSALYCRARCIGWPFDDAPAGRAQTD